MTTEKLESDKSKLTKTSTGYTPVSQSEKKKAVSDPKFQDNSVNEPITETKTDKPIPDFDRMLKQAETYAAILEEFDSKRFTQPVKKLKGFIWTMREVGVKL